MNLFLELQRGYRPRLDEAALLLPEGGAMSWRELDALSARLVGLLRRRGVAAGDRVVVQVEKSPAAVALWLACLRGGVVMVPLNTAYTSAEVAYFLEDADAKLFVASSACEADGVEVAVLAATAATGLWSEALGSEADEAVTPRGDDELAAIVYTSGTTGRSKGAMLTHRNLASNARTLHALWGFSARDVLLHALPIFHVHGLFVALHCAMLSGSGIRFLPRFDAQELRRQLRGSTVLMGVPTFYTRLLALEDFGAADCASMRLFLSGSAPLLAETWRDFERRSGHRILERYGMTETGMITSNPLVGDRVPGTVGFALPDVEVRIVGEDGVPAPAGDTGVLEVRGPNVFPGYWRQPEKTAAEFRDGGWFVTGDLATADDEGRVTLVGRARDLIISGGLNIYPKELEELLDALDGVAESAVIGVPDADFGEAVVAVLVAEPGATICEEALMAAIRPRLARFKHPRRIEIVTELPRNAMGKVQKNALRQRFSC